MEMFGQPLVAFRDEGLIAFEAEVDGSFTLNNFSFYATGCENQVKRSLFFSEAPFAKACLWRSADLSTSAEWTLPTRDLDPFVDT